METETIEEIDFRTKHLERLSEKQKEIVLYTQTHARVIACPGSGKTSTILSHLAELILSQSVNPKRILVLAFNRSVAQKLKEDLITKHILQPEQLPEIATLHGYALSLLYKYKLSHYFGKTCFPYEESGSKNDEKDKIIEPLLYNFLKTHGFTTNRKKFYNELWKPYSLHYWYGRTQILNDKLKTFHQGIEFLRGIFGMRFLSELPSELYRLLNTSPSIADKNYFDHVVIDEFQDLNPADRNLIKILASLGSRVCIVGDDDQSIYGFRGADPTGLLNFHEEFPNTKSFALDDCFRCPRNIIEYAKLIISQHPKRLTDKKINGLSSTQGVVRQLEFTTEKNEISSIVQLVKDYLTKAPSEIDFAGRKIKKSILILLSNNEFLDNYRKKFAEAGIETQSETNLLEIPSVHLIWLLLRYFTNQDQLALYKILEFKFPQLWKKVFTKIFTERHYNQPMEEQLKNIFTNPEEFGELLYDMDEFYAKLIRLRDSLDDGSDIDVQLNKLFTGGQLLLPEINDEHGQKFIRDLIKATKAQEEHIRNLNELGWILHDLLFEKPSEDHSVVTLTSLRKAKGLEADIVLMVGIEDNIIPGDKDYNESIRLLYVGATRPQRALFVTYTKVRIHNRYASGDKNVFKGPSKFLPTTPRFENGNLVCEEIINQGNYWSAIL